MPTQFFFEDRSVLGEFNVVKFTFENRGWETTIRMDSLRDIGRLAVELKSPKEAGSDARQRPRLTRYRTQTPG